MGILVNHTVTSVLTGIVAVLIIALNAYLVFQAFVAG
jgi:Mn2+/Fe2+ NRAMP family transporter